MGNLLYTRRWSKKTGKWIPVKIPEKKTYSYIPYLIATAFESREKDVLPMTRKTPLSDDDPRRKAASIAKLPAPPSEELAAKIKSRF